MSKIVTLEELGIDPAAVADQAVVYSKDVSGVTQLFARASNGTIYQLTPVSGGGGSVWVPGAYSAGAIVTRGPYLWMANMLTTEDPWDVQGNMGLNADWSVATTGGSGMLQTPTPVDGAPNGRLRMINNALGASTCAYRQSTINGFLGKMIACDLSLSGQADGIYFGTFDPAAIQTATNLQFAGSTFYGVYIDIFNSRVDAVADGVSAGFTGYNRNNMVNCGDTFDRWYMRMIQNGANWDLEVLRKAWDMAASTGSPSFTPYSRYQYDDLIPVMRVTNVARPAYTTWRPVVGARTGGSAGIFQIRAMGVRNVVSNAWTAISRLPTQIGTTAL